MPNVQTGAVLLVWCENKCVVLTVCVMVMCSDGAMLGGETQYLILSIEIVSIEPPPPSDGVITTQNIFRLPSQIFSLCGPDNSEAALWSLSFITIR